MKRSNSFPRDVLREFADSMRAAGLGIGWYYRCVAAGRGAARAGPGVTPCPLPRPSFPVGSTGNNFFLNTADHKVQPGPLLPGQVGVSQEEYDKLVLEQVKELWTAFGPLTEIWFDHGYGTAIKGQVQQLLAELQPQAVGFAGKGVTPNPARWVGTESGHPGYPIWSTAESDGQGDPEAATWFPAACDTTLQDWDHWFFVPGMGIRSLDEVGVAAAWLPPAPRGRPTSLPRHR